MKFDLSQSFDLKKFGLYTEKLISKKAKCDLKEAKMKRSIDQNKYLHVCISCFCAETGYTIEEGKIVLKRAFGSFMVYSKNNRKFLLSSAELDTEQMSFFIEWIRNTACFENLGVYVPTSEEYLENQFEISKQLNHVR